MTCNRLFTSTKYAAMEDTINLHKTYVHVWHLHLGLDMNCLRE